MVIAAAAARERVGDVVHGRRVELSCEEDDDDFDRVCELELPEDGVEDNFFSFFCCCLALKSSARDAFRFDPLLRKKDEEEDDDVGADEDEEEEEDTCAGSVCLSFFLFTSEASVP